MSLVKLAYFLNYKIYSRNQYLFHEGDQTDGIYFVKNGEFVISKKIFEKSEAPKRVLGC